MIYLLLAVASSAMVSLIMRASEARIQNTMGMFMANYAVCMLLSRVFMGQARLFAVRPGMGFAVTLGVLGGVLYLGGFVLMKQSMLRNGAMLSAAFMKLGVVVPTVMAVAVFGERPGPVRILGIFAALAAVCLIQFEKEQAGAGKKKGLLVILLLVSGFSDSLSNVYDKLGEAALKDHFLFYIFLTAFLLATALGLCGKKKIHGGDLLWGVLIGIPNYFSARFLLLALGEVPAAAAYPVYSVGTIIVVSLVSVILWKERLSSRKKLALGVILVSLALLNV